MMSPRLADPRDGWTAELLKRGCEAAARELGELTGQPVQIAITEVDVLTREATIARLAVEDDGEVAGAGESFDGALSGRALLAFRERDGLGLVRRLLRQDDDPEFMTEMDHAALTEIANIVINACLDDFGKGSGGGIGSGVPVPFRGTMARILRELSPEATDLLAVSLQTRFSLDGSEIPAHLVFLTATEGFDRFWRAAVRDIRFPVPLHG